MTLPKTDTSGQKSAEEGDWSDTQSEDDEVKPSLCCLQGCLATSAVIFSFIVALPTGILLLVYYGNNSDVALLAVGCVLVVMPVLTLLILIVVCLNKKRILKLGKNKVNCIEMKDPQEKYNERY